MLFTQLNVYPCCLHYYLFFFFRVASLTCGTKLTFVCSFLEVCHCFFFLSFHGLGDVQTFCCNWRFILHTLPQKDCSQGHMHTDSDTGMHTLTQMVQTRPLLISIHMHTPSLRRRPEHNGRAKSRCSPVVPADSGTFTVTDRGKLSGPK